MIWIFWGAAALLAYTYAGYPAWLWLRARFRRIPVRAGDTNLRLSIAMVVRNEERVIRAKLENLLTLDYPAELLDIVIVSDGSTDQTDTILHELAQNSRVQVVLNQLSQGKASGLNDAMQVAQGDVVVFTDARQTIESAALRRLVRNFADPQVGCVSGELMLGDPDSGEADYGMGVYWRIEKKVRELESASGSVVGATGALYGVRRELLVPVPPQTLLDDVYIPMQVLRSGKRVVFEPEARAWDSPDQGAGREFSRKVRTLSGNYQLVQLMPWILSSNNPVRFEFISHKLLRLLGPFALMAALISSALLPQAFYRMAFLLQLAFYASSLLGKFGIRLGPLARVGDAAFTFVVLNMAAAVAFANFVTGRRAAWTR